MGESSDTPLKLQFDRRVRLDFRGATITSDADASVGLARAGSDDRDPVHRLEFWRSDAIHRNRRGNLSDLDGYWQARNLGGRGVEAAGFTAVANTMPTASGRPLWPS